MTKYKIHRAIEAILFASSGPLKISELHLRFPEVSNIEDILKELKETYKDRGVILCENNGNWSFQTAPDLSSYMQEFKNIRKKLSKAGLETLSIIAYHQPITRPEIEQIRGVTVHAGTLDILFEAGWIEPKGKKEVPGKPSFWRTTEYFLNYFDLEKITDLPSLRELKEAGLLTKENPLKNYMKLGNNE